jgi:hypothetical protein
MLCGVHQHVISFLPFTPVSIAGYDVLPVSTVCSLGVMVESDLCTASHVRLVIPRCYTALSCDNYVDTSAMNASSL